MSTVFTFIFSYLLSFHSFNFFVRHWSKLCVSDAHLRVREKHVIIIVSVNSHEWSFYAPVANFNTIQTGLFWHSLDWGGVSNAPPPHPLHFLKTIQCKRYRHETYTHPLFKHHEIKLLLLPYHSCDVT